MIDTTLQKLGLHEDEAKAFLFLLEHGPETAGMLAKKTGISRPSLYGFLKNMQTLGLVSESQRNGVKTFQASSKEKILLIMNTRIGELEKGRMEMAKMFSEIEKGGVDENPSEYDSRLEHQKAGRAEQARDGLGEITERLWVIVHAKAEAAPAGTREVFTTTHNSHSFPVTRSHRGAPAATSAATCDRSRHQRSPRR